MTDLIDVPRGLKGVAAAETRIGDVRGSEGFYHYGAYNATRLARERSLEEAWFLVRTGRLPDSAELEEFTRLVAAHRAVPPDVIAALPTVARLASDDRPLEALRAAYELFVLVKRYQPWIDLDVETLDRQALETAAVFAPIVVALHRLARGEEPIPARADLGHAANYLYMLEGREPSAEHARARRGSTSSRRSTTASTRRRSPRASSRRPAPTSRSAVVGGDRRAFAARCTAARRAGRSTCSTRSATVDKPSRGCARRVERGDEADGLRPPRLPDDDPRT